MLVVILMVLLIVFAVGGFPGWYGSGWGYGHYGLGLILVVLVVLLLAGRLCTVRGRVMPWYAWERRPRPHRRRAPRARGRVSRLRKEVRAW